MNDERHDEAEPEEEERTPEPGTTVRAFLESLRHAIPDFGAPVVRAARSRLTWLAATAVGLLVGSASAFLVVLLVAALPGVPGIVIGFGAGALLGATAALVIVSRSGMVRRWGAFAILLSPVLILLGPFLLLGVAIALLTRRARSPRAP